jgi:ABC-type phosphate/phosphonate transport system ATPase subunit
MAFPNADRSEAEDLLRTLGLEREVHRQVRLLSGGQQQRVAIARTLFQRPRLLLADEPVSSLDQKLAHETFTRLKEHTRATGAAMVCVTHDLSWVAEFGDRVLHFDGHLAGNSAKSWTISGV